MSSDLSGRFDALDQAGIEAFISEGQEENLHLDFKTVTGSQLESRDDRRNFARALSGFANSDGGIIVWGVIARKADGVDCAKGRDAVPDVVAFVSRLNQLTSDMVSPSVDGVLHKVVEVGDAGEGIAATLVPRSESGPHMAKGGEDRYYKRAGDSFIRLEHFDVADMFGRRPKPVLRLGYEIRDESSIVTGGDASRKILVVLSIENSGRGSAMAPYLAVAVREPDRLGYCGIDRNGHTGLPNVGSSNGKVVFAGAADTLIHPRYGA